MCRVPAGRSGAALGGGLEVVEVRPAGADRVAHALPALAVAVEVAVFERDPRAVGRLGDEGDGDLARLGRVGLDLPAGVDVPAEDEEGGGLVGEDARPSPPAGEVRGPALSGRGRR
jgi:hypothetical protein